MISVSRLISLTQKTLNKIDVQPVNFARRCHQARNVEHFDFDLTCDVTRDPEVNKICFPMTVFSRAFKCRLNV